MLPGAHVPDRAGLLAVAGQARRGQLVERRALEPQASSAWLTPDRR